jgi:hypothetical protein
MTVIVANTRRRLIITGVLIFTGVLFAIASANIFPDQTWNVLNKLWPETLSRLWPMPTGAYRTAEEDNIYEAVFQYIIVSNNLRGPIYLSLGGKDPSDRLMARFSNRNLDVKRLSEAKQSPLSGFDDPSKGEHGVVIAVFPVKWFFWDRVQVEGGLHYGNLSGSGGTYEVVKKRGQWNVESYTKRWVS